MKENNDFEKKLESAFSEQAAEDSLINLSGSKKAGLKKITAKPNYFPYVIIFILVSIIVFTAFESANISGAVKNTGDSSMNEILYARDISTNSLLDAFQSGKISLIFAFLLFEGFVLYIIFLILESLFGFVLTLFRSKEAKDIKTLF